MNRTPTPSPPPSPDVHPPKRRNACSDESRKKQKKRKEYIFFEIRKPSPINFDDDEGMASSSNEIYSDYKQPEDERPLKYLDIELNIIDGLIKVGKDYIDGKYDDNYRYNINVYTLSR